MKHPRRVAIQISTATGTNRWQLYLMLVGIMALWGGTWPVGRVVSATVAPWNAALLRFAMADVVLLAICLWTQGAGSLRVPGHLWPRLVLLGATGIFGYSFFFFTGLKTTEAARAGLIVGCIPACIALCSAVAARTWPSLWRMTGILISLAGVWLVISRGDLRTVLRGEVRVGDLLILGCVGCWVGYTLFARPVMRELSPLVTVTWSCVLGTVLILRFALAGGITGELAAIQSAAWLGLVYLAIPATSLAYFGYYHAIHRIGGGATGIFINLVPVFALVFGCLFLREALAVGELAGGFLVVAGVMLALREPRKLTRPVQ